MEEEEEEEEDEDKKRERERENESHLLMNPKNKIELILNGYGHEELQDHLHELQSRNHQIEEERIRLSRQMNEIRKTKEERERQAKKLQDEIQLMKKQSLVMIERLIDELICFD